MSETFTIDRLVLAQAALAQATVRELHERVGRLAAEHALATAAWRDALEVEHRRSEAITALVSEGGLYVLVGAIDLDTGRCERRRVTPLGEAP